MNNLKTYEDFLFESKLNEGKVEVQTVSYVNYDGPGWDYFATDTGFHNSQEMVEQYVHDLKLISGDLYMERRYIKIEGITRSGQKLFIEQDGEFDMYGGPYTPKMKKPKITLDGKDIYRLVKKNFEDYGYDAQGTDIDVTRTDIYEGILK